MNTDTLLHLDRQHLWHPFTQEATAPPAMLLASARGAYLYRDDGTALLDLISSWWVNLHGHAHPKIAQAIAAQALTLEQVIFAGFTHEPAVRLAARLIEQAPGELNRVFYSDDGSTAVEVALKMAIQYWHNRGQIRPRIAAMVGAYHGDTFGAMAVGQSSGFFAPFSTHHFAVESLPYPATWIDDEAVEAKEAAALRALDEYLQRQGEHTAALIIEPLVQGASGMRMCRPQFLQKLAARLKKNDIFLIFDEVMTGFGRTGSLFASERAQVAPDILCLSKGLTGGFLPLSVTLCTETLYDGFRGPSFDQALAHGHSYTANPLGCAAALASLELFEEEQSLQRVARMEQSHVDFVSHLATEIPIQHPRVMGSIVAMELPAKDAGYQAEIGKKIREAFLEHGLLLRPLGNCLYLMPPYAISDSDLERAYQIIEQVLTHHLRLIS